MRHAGIVAALWKSDADCRTASSPNHASLPEIDLAMSSVPNGLLRGLHTVPARHLAALHCSAATFHAVPNRRSRSFRAHLGRRLVTPDTWEHARRGKRTDQLPVEIRRIEQDRINLGILIICLDCIRFIKRLVLQRQRRYPVGGRQCNVVELDIGVVFGQYDLANNGYIDNVRLTPDRGRSRR